MREPLTPLGMSLAFTPHANFSGINGSRPLDENALFMGRVLHKAVVEVNEEGAEAAAPTATIMTLADRLRSRP